MSQFSCGWIILIGQLIHVISLTSSATLGSVGMDTDDIPYKKRPALSFNQDLQSLADMLTGGRAASRSHLLSMGKRAPALSFNQDLLSLANMLDSNGASSSRSSLMRLGKRERSNTDDGKYYTAEKKRSPSLSFNQDLQSLSDMMARGRMDSAQNQLMRLGKRGRPLSFTQDLASIADMLHNDRSNTHSHLLSLGKRTYDQGVDLADDDAIQTSND